MFVTSLKLFHLLGLLLYLFYLLSNKYILGFPGGSVIKNLPANARDVGLIPWLVRYPGEENGNLLQYSCLPGKSHGQRSLEGYSPWGHKRIGHGLATKQQICVTICLKHIELLMVLRPF